MPARLHRTLAATATVLALAALPALTSSPATAVPAPTRAAAAAAAESSLPPIGAEIPSSMISINTPIRIGGSLLRVDLRGGIKQRVEPNPDNPNHSVRLRTIGFRMTGELPDGGTITMEQNDIDVDANSTLTVEQASPPKLVERDELSFSVTIEQPDQDPVVLVSRDPMVLKGNLTQFPARGDLYRLVQPVDLVDPENPDSATATIEQFPVRRGGL
ncbi:hypothetical protein [Streptomyces sp. NPDC057682]|uniref:hypothetical protein n=1 Tax=Streptomyces sp. NPDC057682 TaxID=3346210 RepID=UPI003694371F